MDAPVSLSFTTEYIQWKWVWRYSEKSKLSATERTSIKNSCHTDANREHWCEEEARSALLVSFCLRIPVFDWFRSKPDSLGLTGFTMMYSPDKMMGSKGLHGAPITAPGCFPSGRYSPPPYRAAPDPMPPPPRRCMPNPTVSNHHFIPSFIRTFNLRHRDVNFLREQGIDEDSISQ